ncbi:cellulose-binding protein CttA-related protein [Ruminococcus flavefaciens]|uniref:Cellulose-binding protein CttA N-terminal domain-containing protein n=1 Tax=Ruminococcus flavefaciens TaxID=1265 RepID=A0A1K1NXP1_RUMFL|nr:cellulose-binding protein CttA-related protein [Ruminococcus flavefaciens]SFW40100.1 hypothetical protein SAMN02910280_2315 [Ruminococcus flavefaciens]
MKNSLFKRAIAAAAAVPLALTQCLTYANAVDGDTATTTTANVQAQSQESTLKALLAIPGDAKILGPDKKGAAYNRQQSTWEQTALLLLNSLGTKDDGRIDLTPYINKALANAGDYSDVAKVFADLIDGKKVDYTFDGKKLTVKGKINELNYNEFIGVSDAFKIDAFDDIVLGGDFVIVVDGSTIDANQTVTAEFKYTCEGKTYTLGEVPALIKDKFTAIKAKAEKEIGAGVDEKAKADFFDKLDKIIKVATKADNGVTKALAFDWNYTTAQEKNNAADAITKLNAKIKSYGINKQLPPTASDIASNSKVAAAFAEISEKTNGKVTISAAEVGKLADEVGGRSIKKGDDVVVSTPLSASIFGGVGTFTAAFDDDADEVADLKKKVEAEGHQLVGSYKKAYARVDFSDIKDTGKASLSLSLDRILVTDTTTTTTSTTTTSSSTTTSTTTKVNPDDSTTTSSTTTKVNPDDTTTTTTTTKPIELKKIKRQYAKNGYTKTAAFYLNTEEEFNKKQISDVTLVIEYTDGSTEDRVVAADDINFGTAKPTNTYKKDSTDFKYAVQVYVKDVALTDELGENITVDAYIGVRGDADLNSTANAVDASVVLTYYAKLSTNDAEGNSNRPSNTKLSTSNLVTSARNIYDDFAAYLCDVEHDVTFDNLTKKVTRNKTINAVDASSILQFYAQRQLAANKGKTDAEVWAIVDSNNNNTSASEEV